MSSEDLDDILLATDPELSEIGELLGDGRTAPSAAFRGELRRRLLAAPVPMSGGRLWLLLAGLLACGAIALGIVGLGLAGQGPLAPAGGPSHRAQVGGR